MFIEFPFNTKYKVSHDGKILGPSGLILKPRVKNGYENVVLYAADGERQYWRVSRMVAYVFCDPPSNHDDLEVAHYDGDKRNNHFTNIRYTTAYENAQDNVRHGKSAVGERNNFAKLTEDQALAIVLGDVTPAEAAVQFGITAGHAADIKAGRAWGHLQTASTNVAKVSPRRRLSDEEVRAIRGRPGEKMTNLAKEYGCSTRTISKIRKRMTRKDVD